MLSIAQLKARIPVVPEIPHTACDGRNCACKKVSNLRNALSTEVNNVYSSVSGLCMDSIRRAGVGDTRKCRIMHDMNGRKIGY